MLTFDGKPTNARFEEEIYPIARMVARTAIEKTVDVVLLRRKKRMTLRLTTQDLGQAVGEDFEAEAWGMTVKEITPSMARMLALDDHDGVLATGTLSESVAAKAKIGNRDVIRKIDGIVITDLAKFQEVYEKLAGETSRKVMVDVLQGGRTPRRLVMDLSGAKKLGRDAKSKGGAK